jgi:hypothetical protein
MGQPITISGTTVDDAVAAFHTDRGISGQDGVAFASADAADHSFPGQLASRLFAADDAIDHVFVVSNQVVLRRAGGWDDISLESASSVVEEFFVFYADVSTDA